MIKFAGNTRIFCTVFLLSVVFVTVLGQCIDGCRCSSIRKMQCPGDKKLTKFPSGINNSTEYIIIKNNEISELPGNLSYMLPNLTRLNLMGNKLKVLPSKVFSNLKKLTSVGLSNNKISEIGGYIFEGCEAESLILALSGNGISHIDGDAFKGLTAYITEIHLQKNALESLHEDTFSETTNLHTLDLSLNRIKSLHPNLFRNLQLAYYLKLRENKLSSLDEQLFKNMAGLETLDLSYNQLSELPENIFKNNEVLKKLNLKNNVFNTPPTGIPYTAQVSLENNPIYCDCDLKQRTLRPEFQEQFVDFRSSVACENDERKRLTSEYLEELDCETSTSAATTLDPVIMTGGVGPIEVVTKITTRTIIYDKTEKNNDGTSWPIVLGVLLGILVFIVIVGLFMYLYRRRIRDKIVEGTLTLTRQKKKIERTDNAEDFKYHDVAGWDGARTAMLKQTEGNV